MPDKQHTLWLHGNTLLKPMHSIAPPPQMASEYAEVTQAIIPKQNQMSAPPEPYATVTLQRGAQSDDSCIKCSASPSSSEYNAPVREPLNLCDVLPPPPDHPYGVYKPPNNMTIRTNPVAMSPQIGRRVPPIPTFPQNWQPKIIKNNRTANTSHLNMDHTHPNQDYYAENDYESGSVLYAQCCRPDENNTEFFNRGGEPTEEYYRNINMEFLDEQQDFEPSTPPPPPCPDPYNNPNIRYNNPNLRLLTNGMVHMNGVHTMQHPQQQQPHHQDSSPSLNTRRPMRGNTVANKGSNGIGSNKSSDESESDNRWAPQTRRSRSKSTDRKRGNHHHHDNTISVGLGHYIR